MHIDKIFLRKIVILIFLMFCSVRGEINHESQENFLDECITDSLGLALSIKNTLANFRQLFNDFVNTSSVEIKKQIIDAVVMLCLQLNRTNDAIDEQDAVLYSKYLSAAQLMNTVFHTDAQAILDEQLRADKLFNQFIVQLSELSFASGTVVDTLCTQLSNLQKNANVALSTCSTEVSAVFMELNSFLQEQLSSVLRDLNLVINDFCLLLYGMKINIESQLAEHQSSFNANSAVKQKQMLIEIDQIEHKLHSLIKTQLSEIATQLAARQTHTSTALSSLFIDGSNNVNQLLVYAAQWGKSLTDSTSSIEQAFVIFVDLINKSIAKQELCITKALVNFVDQFRMQLDFFEADIQKRVAKQFTGVIKAFFNDTAVLGSKIEVLQQEMECSVEESLTQSQLLIIQSIAKLELKIAALDNNIVEHTANIKRQLSCLDAELRSTICEKFSTVEIKQQIFGQEIIDQLSSMYNHLNGLSSSKISHLQKNLADQNNGICAQLVSFKADVDSIAKEQFVNNENLQAVNNALLCAKINTFQAQIGELIITKLSTFAKDIAVQNDELCSKIVATQSDLNNLISSEFMTAVDRIEQSIMTYCEKIETTKDDIAGQSDFICQKIKDLDVSLVDFVESQAESVESVLDELLDVIIILNEFITIINRVFSFTAAGKVSKPVAAPVPAPVPAP